MKCESCLEELVEGCIRWAFDEPYCEACFDELFNYCSRCDTVIQRDLTVYNSEGDSFCQSCYEDDYDDEAPNNPDVTESDREHIVRLSRSWLQGKVVNKRLISINEKDIYLKTIKDKVGPVEKPIYLFGLIDRDEYNISVSENLQDEVDETMHLLGVRGILHLDSGCNRLGLSLTLREKHLPEIVTLIKKITTQIVPEPVLQD